MNPPVTANRERNRLNCAIRKIIYLKMIMKRERELERKADTRKKIMLGGLIIKAGLDYLHPHDASVIYGMLLDCRQALHNQPRLKAKWRSMGREITVPKLK